MKKLLVLLFSLLISFNSYGETRYSYYENGQIEEETNFKDGKFDGKKLGWGKGKFGGGLVFGGNGPRDHIVVPDSESLWLKDGLTVEMWVYLNFWSSAGGTGATKEKSYKIEPRALVEPSSE